MSDAVFRALHEQFAADCAADLWQWIPVTPGLMEVATSMFRRLPRSVHLRSADALHLTAAREHGFREVHTNDRHMLAAARHFRLRPVTIESVKSD